MGDWNEVINDFGNNIRGGLQEGRARIQREDAEAEQNRFLHPTTQKWMQKMMAGEMSPAEAAAAAHDEIDSVQGPPMVSGGQAPEPASTGKLMEPGDMGDTSQPFAAPRMPAPSGLAAARRPNPERPFTVRDAKDAVNLAPLERAQRPDPIAAINARRDAKLVTDEASGARTATNVKAKLSSAEEIAANRLQYDYFKLKQSMEMKLQELDAAMARVTAKGATDKDIAKAKIIASEYNAHVAAGAKVVSRLGGDDSEAAQSIREHQAEVEQKGKQINDLLGQITPNKPPDVDDGFGAGAKKAMGKTPEAAPVDANTPDPGTPPIPGSPVDVPAAPVAAAPAPAAPKPQAKSKTILMRFKGPKGFFNAPVPFDKVEAALKKGGTRVGG